MVTFTKTFDVTRLCKVSRRRGLKFNMLLCWCIGKTASKIEEFYLLPHDGKLYKYDRMAINTIAENVKGGLSFCDIAVTDDLEQFNANYLHLTETISQTCQDILDDGAVIVGTSAITGTELDCMFILLIKFLLVFGAVHYLNALVNLSRVIHSHPLF